MYRISNPAFSSITLYFDIIQAVPIKRTIPPTIFQLYLKSNIDLFHQYIVHDIIKYDIIVAIAAPRYALSN